MSDPDRVLFFLLKPVVRACKEFDLLSDGDRIAVAVSGGKDSRALLQLLLLRCQRKMPCRYELLALLLLVRRLASPTCVPNSNHRFGDSASSITSLRWDCRRRNRYRSHAFAAHGTGARRFSPPPSGWATINWPSATTPTTQPLQRS